LPLLLHEPRSDAVRRLFAGDGDVIAWWATPVECVSAATRLERDGSLDADGLDRVLERLDGLARAWVEIEPSDRVRAVARRLLRVHSLRAADALQLGAAHVAAEAHAGSLGFVTLDRRLAEAARREGFPVEPR
jgi:predicted nucleic acid-binding protein